MPAKKKSPAKCPPAIVSGLIVPEKIAPLVHYLRHEKVILDSDLAELYGVETRVINQAAQRNSDRFPSDFMFQLTENEMEILRSQIVTSKNAEPSLRSQTVILKRGQHRKYLPYAFTEQGVAMLSSVLRSPRAVEVNIGASSMTLPIINKSTFQALQIPVPPKELREKFAVQVTNFEKAANQQTTSTATLETLFQTLLHRAFDGSLTAKWREAHAEELLQEMKRTSRRS